MRFLDSLLGESPIFVLIKTKTYSMKKLTTLLCIGLMAVLLTSGNNKHVKLFLIGDSTMADKTPVDGNPERGWGMVLPSYFNEDVVI